MRLCRCFELQDELKFLKQEIARLKSMEIPEEVTIQIEELEKQVWELKSVVKQERSQHARHKAELLKAKHQLSAVPNLKKRIKHLQQIRTELRKELLKFQRYVKTNCIDKDEMERVTNKLESFAAHELNVKLAEMRMYLDQKTKAQEQLDQARLNNEVQMRSDLQISKNELQEEIHRLRLALDRSESKVEGLRLERDHLQELYGNHSDVRPHRTAKEFQGSNGHSASSFDLLSAEDLVVEPHVSLRNNKLKQLKESLIYSNPAELSGQSNMDNSPISMIYKVKAALDKSIEHHLLNQQPY